MVLYTKWGKAILKTYKYITKRSAEACKGASAKYLEPGSPQTQDPPPAPLTIL